MKTAAATLAAAGLAAASVFEANRLPELTSANAMSVLRQLKQSQRDSDRSVGAFDEERYTSLSAAPCSSGSVGEYSCGNVDLTGSLTHGDMGSTDREGNDIWGWTSEDGREFALVGQTDGTAFVEVLEGGALQYLGRLPTQSSSSLWRDLKVIGNHVYIGSEARSHGIQVFDLTKLLTIDPASPVTFSTSSDLTAHWSGVSNSHNVVANEETEKLYVVGANTCSGGLVILDVSDPSSPQQVGCASSDGYVHDAQCVVYNGVDTKYTGREICYGYNEDTFTIYDVTEPSSPVIVSRVPYQGVRYSHQGWVVDAESRYVLLDDELDEQYNGEEGGRTKTHIFDISSLESPVYTGSHFAVTPAIDHNQYVVDGLSYQANYASGLRIIDVSALAEDPTGGNLSEVGFFDCYPEDDASPRVAFNGAWSVYPYFSSGIIIVNCIERGLFAVQYTG